MEISGTPIFMVDVCGTRKKRSNFPRRPHPDPKPISVHHHVFQLHSLVKDNGGYGDINPFDGNGNSRTGQDFGSCSRNFLANQFGYCEFYFDRIRDKIVESDQLGNESKVKKVKLKVGGVTRTIQAKSRSDGRDGSESHGPWPKQAFQDFDRNGVCSGKEGASRGKCGEDSALNETHKHEPVRKSKRIPKRRALDVVFNEDDDDEIRYLGKLQASRAAADCGDKQQERSRKSGDILKAQDSSHESCSLYTGDSRGYGSSGFCKDGRKQSRMHEDQDYVKGRDPTSDDEFNDKSKKLKKESYDSPINYVQPLAMTTRKRALQSGGDIFPASEGKPADLPAVPPKKQKGMLSEVDQQLKKAEAAQRCRLQAAKAAKEAEAEAIRKILGQDSNRNKREEKLKKQQEELAQEKLAKAAALGPNTVGWVMGPSGTVVTFSEDIGLPGIFNPLPSRYPPPREKCVGPNCTNAYKYRDSKSRLPLCSLHCYKAAQGNMELLPASAY